MISFFCEFLSHLRNTFLMIFTTYLSVSLMSVFLCHWLDFKFLIRTICSYKNNMNKPSIHLFLKNQSWCLRYKKIFNKCLLMNEVVKSPLLSLASQSLQYWCKDRPESHNNFIVWHSHPGDCFLLFYHFVTCGKNYFNIRTSNYNFFL